MKTGLLTAGLGAAGVAALLLSGGVGARTDPDRQIDRPADATPPLQSPADARRLAQAMQLAAAQPTGPAAFPAPAVPAPAAPEPAPDISQAGVDALMQDPAAVARINAQIEALMQPQQGGFAVTYYAKPAPPPPPPGAPPGQFGQMPPGATPPLRPGEVKRDRAGNPERYVIARAGDTVYATLDRAFNSDDPQAPLFVTIHDVDDAGIQGPLDGVRAIGNIKYSSSESAIQFDRGYLPDGRPLDLKGIGISETTARTGFAKDVDNHEIQRYGGLLLATLVQGAGQVGQILLQTNQQATVDPATGLLVASQRVSPYQAILAGALPAGQALTAVAAQGFNKPATISAPAGFGLGIVFLQPVVVPGDLLFARGR